MDTIGGSQTSHLSAKAKLQLLLPHVLCFAGIFIILHIGHLPSEILACPGSTPCRHTSPVHDKTDELFAMLIDGRPAQARLASNRIMIQHNQRFIPVYIELLRASEEGLIPHGNRMLYVNVLRRLSGKDLGYDWKAWDAWYRTTDITPPARFEYWKTWLRKDPRNKTSYQGIGEIV